MPDDEQARRAALEALLERQFEEPLSEQEAAELRDLLSDDEASQDFYLRHCELHAMLLEERAVLDQVAADPQKLFTLPSGTSNLPKASRQSVQPSKTPPSAGVKTATGMWGSFTPGGGSAVRKATFGGLCLAAGVLLALSFGPMITESTRPPTAEIVPLGPPEITLVRETELPDGSKVELAPRTEISVRYEPEKRAVELKDGEAHFSAVPNDSRPFVVAAGEVRIVAVGTAFNVRRAGTRIVVTVTEGRVRIEKGVGVEVERAASNRAFLVSEGSQFRWDEDEGEAGLVLASVEPADALAWRAGRLEYTNEPLRAVVADLNRYSDRPIVLESEAVGRLRVAGTIFVRATSRWLMTLPRSLPVRVEQEANRYRIVADESSLPDEW